MIHSALEHKIQTEAARLGITSYTIKEDQYVFTRNAPENKLILEVNSKDLVIFHSPSILITRSATFGLFEQIEAQGSHENRLHKLVGGDFDIHIDPSTNLHFARIRPPFMFGSKGKTVITVTGTNGAGASGYILGITVSPIY